MGIPRDTSPDDVIVDQHGEKWRLAYCYSNPTYCFQSEDHPAKRLIGEAGTFAGFRRTEQPNKPKLECHTCPDRQGRYLPGEERRENSGTWNFLPNGDRVCSWCGSMHP